MSSELQEIINDELEWYAEHDGLFLTDTGYYICVQDTSDYDSWIDYKIYGPNGEEEDGGLFGDNFTVRWIENCLGLKGPSTLGIYGSRAFELAAPLILESYYDPYMYTEPSKYGTKVTKITEAPQF